MHSYNFWIEDSGPFFLLAPMEDVTDTAFREVVLRVSHPSQLNVLFTEFTSVDGLLDHRGFAKVSERLFVSASEREMLRARKTRLVAQIWGNDPEKFLKVSKIVTEMNAFDGIDINMGCPVKKVVAKGTCSALIKDPSLAKEIIRATMEGSNLPVSVKTRIGFNTVITEEWATHLLETKPAAITFHGRIQKQQSDGLADWDEIAKAVKLRDQLGSTTRIIGNGDANSFSDCLQKIAQYGTDGVMVGRGIFKDPWMFNTSSIPRSVQEKLKVLKTHVSLYDEVWKGKRNFNVLKRFFKIYVNSFAGSGDLRAQLMNTQNASEVFEVIRKFENAPMELLPTDEGYPINPNPTL